MENYHEISDEELLAWAEKQCRMYAAGAIYQGIGTNAWMDLAIDASRGPAPREMKIMIFYLSELKSLLDNHRVFVEEPAGSEVARQNAPRVLTGGFGDLRPGSVHRCLRFHIGPDTMSRKVVGIDVGAHSRPECFAGVPRETSWTVAIHSSSRKQPGQKSLCEKEEESWISHG